MTGNKATLHFIRTADMTLPAGGMTRLAVIFQCRVQRRTLGHIAAPGFKSSLKSGERGMQAYLVSVSDILMTGIAVTFRRVDDHTGVSQFLIIGTAVTTVADNTAYLAVGALQKLGILNEDFLPHLQRR